MAFFEKMLNGSLLFDGAMGTLLQKHVVAGVMPETLNVTCPEVVIDLHKQYVAAGSDIVTANTFGANELKLRGSGYSVESIVSAGVKNAKKSGAKYVALAIGPTGQMLEPMGTFKFEEAYNLFKTQIVAANNCGADLVLIETMSDLYEAKAAILAAKENSDLPVFCTMTFQQNLRTFMGCDALTALVTLEGLNVDAIGVNCSLGPKQLVPIVEVFIKYCKKPIILQPNAGLPKHNRHDILYEVTAQEYVQCMADFFRKGVNILGGCCGTTPQYISLLKKAITNIKPEKRTPCAITAASSGTKTVVLKDEGVYVVGERINAVAKKEIRDALKTDNFTYVLSEAVDQMKAGADILDVNCSLLDVDEAKTLTHVIKTLQSIVDLPLQIDSTDPVAVEKAIRVYNGKPVINSVNGSKKSMEKIFPIAKKYGALIVGLTLDEQGIPKTAKERFNIAQKIINTANSYDISKDDILIDCLALAVSAEQQQAMETLKAIPLVKTLDVKTVLGISNISFGLPEREFLNSVYLSVALSKGLDVPIVDPLSHITMNTIKAFRVLNNEDANIIQYIVNFSDVPKSLTVETNLMNLILEGQKEKVAQTVNQLLISEIKPLDIIDNYFTPALNVVGEQYERGELFLPHLMRSAEAVKAGFQIIQSSMSTSALSKGKILVATVKGDIHDIGKNIAKILLETYGYEIIDLGRDVPPETIIQNVKTHNIKLVGLSALMTTTIPAMKETIEKLRNENLLCTIMVGGAVLNNEYAKSIGADYFAHDALEGIKIANQVFKKQN
ncbi:MAG: homocysteine S-methyltransferase family protein [Nitrososphaerota archaeon]|jgi:5-methyltetrahydrofolate--homocysteine methyltransferase|nr:homocysteine S-methyltransferase family protein [Nitrososphaerota archaeon]